MIKRITAVCCSFAACAALTIATWAGAPKDGVFLSPRHSQVTMKGDWYPELVSGRGGAKYHWFSEKKGESVSLEFEGTSVSIVARVGARLTWRNTTHTNSLARLGVFAARVDGKPLSKISLAGSEAVAKTQPEKSERTNISVAHGLAAGRHVLEVTV